MSIRENYVVTVADLLRALDEHTEITEVQNTNYLPVNDFEVNRWGVFALSGYVGSDLGTLRRKLLAIEDTTQPMVSLDSSLEWAEVNCIEFVGNTMILHCD